MTQRALSNLQRTGERAPAGELEATHLGTTSADAVPTLMGALPGLTLDARCEVARELHLRWGSEAARDRRSCNRSEARARRLVQEAPVGVLSMRGCPEVGTAASGTAPAPDGAGHQT